MPIQTRQPQNKPVFHFLTIFAGFIIGVIFHVTFFFFTHLAVSAFRLFGARYDHGGLILFSQGEQFVINFFFATIAGCLAIMMAFEFVLSNPINHQIQRKTRIRLRRSFSENSFLKSAWLFILIRTLMLLGILYMAFAIQYEFHFLKDYWYIALLLPVALFAPLANIIRKAFGRQYLRVAGTIAVCWLSVSVVLSLVKLKDHQSFEELLYKQQTMTRLNIQLAESREYGHSFIEPLYYINTLDIYVFRDDGTGQLLARTNIDTKTRTLDEILPIAGQWCAYSWGIKAKYCRFYIDQKVLLSDFRTIRESLGRSGCYELFLGVIPENSKYPRHYPLFTKTILRFQTRYSPELETILDSIAGRGDENLMLRIPEGSKFSYLDTRSKNRIRLSIRNGDFFLNDTKMPVDDIGLFIYRFCKKYWNNHKVIIEPDTNTTLGEFIELYSASIYQIRRLRAEKYAEYTGQEYHHIKSGAWMDHTIDNFSYSVVWYTPQEKRIRKLLKP